MLTSITVTRETGLSLVAREFGGRRDVTSAVPGDLSNLLQIAASVLHLIDRQIGDEVHPLVRAGLSAISAAGNLTCSLASLAPLYLMLED